MLLLENIVQYVLWQIYLLGLVRMSKLMRDSCSTFLF